MDKASVFGTEDCRFESYRGQFFSLYEVLCGRLSIGLAEKEALRWSYGVTVSTLDFESSDGGSNPPGTSFF